MKALTQDRDATTQVLTVGEVEKPNPRGGGAGPGRGVADGPLRLHLMAGEFYSLRLLGFGCRVPSVAVPDPTSPQPWTRSAQASAPSSRATRCTARYGVRRASVDQVDPKPPQPTFEQAAVLPYPTFVPMQALRDRGRVAPGQRVYVVGASGAVGSIAVQLAVAFGARVTAVCSSRHADVVRPLGADDVFDDTTEDLTDGSRRFDLVITIGGGTPIAGLRRALTRTGCWSSGRCRTDHSVLAVV